MKDYNKMLELYYEYFGEVQLKPQRSHEIPSFFPQFFPLTIYSEILSPPICAYITL